MYCGVCRKEGFPISAFIICGDWKAILKNGIYVYLKAFNM